MLMKKLTQSILFAGAAAFAVTLMAKPNGGPHGSSHGTDILHYSVRKAMANDAVETNANGSVQAHQNTQGNANNQELDISVKGLTSDATYQLLAGLGGESNLTAVAQFTTDTNGTAVIRYRSQGNGHGGGLGHGRGPLPGVLNPVSNISELDVFNASTQAVLTADMTMPDQLQYLIKRDLGTNGVDALLRIHATTRMTHFSLTASGLSPTNDYFLVLNGDITQTNTADAMGNLRIMSLPFSGSILDLRSLALWDVSSNVVVSTTLP